MAKENAFLSWINNTTTKKISRQLDLDPSTVRQWRRGRNMPRPKTIVKIRALTRGRVKAKDILSHHKSCR